MFVVARCRARLELGRAVGDHDRELGGHACVGVAEGTGDDAELPGAIEADVAADVAVLLKHPAARAVETARVKGELARRNEVPPDGSRSRCR